MSIMDRRTDEVPIAVIDFETTGLSPKTGARVVEVAVARIDPGERPRIVMDTLIDPQGPVYATDIHGITDEDVVGAPPFADMADELTEAIRDAVVASYNASFDMAFLSHELSRAGVFAPAVPFVCLMYLRPLLRTGPRCDLTSACDEVGLAAGAHQAADDAFAEAYLWLAYRDAAKEHGVTTFGDMARLKSYKFTNSFSQVQTPLPATRGTAPKPRTNPLTLEAPDPWPPRLVLGGAPALTETVTIWRDGRLQAEAITASRTTTPQSARRIYWHALVDVTEDLDATSEEAGYLGSLRDRYALDPEQVRALHARLFAERLLEMARDDRFTGVEVARTERLASVLRVLGWCPGMPSSA